MVLLQVDIFHPLAQLSWEECSPLPTATQGADVVTIGNKVFVSAGKNLSWTSKNARLFVSTTSFKSWSVVPTPSTSYNLASYKSRLVLIGGRELPSGEVTNKVWTTDGNADLQWHSSSIPAMLTARHSSTAVGSEDCLVVAGGGGVKKSEVGSIEVLVHNEWVQVPPLPVQISFTKCAIHKGCLYVIGRQKHVRGVVYTCQLDALLKFRTGESTISRKLSVGTECLWTKFENSPQVDSFISFDKHLLSVGGCSDFMLSFSSKVQAFSEHTQSWVRVGNAPEKIYQSTVAALPTGKFAVIGGLHIICSGDYEFHKLHMKQSSRVFIASFCGGETA